MLRALKRARSAIQRHGVTGLTPLVLHNVAHYWRTLGSGPHEPRSAFDEELQVNTERIAEIGALDIASSNARFAVRYQPSAPQLVREILSRLNLNYSDFTLVDFGSGKGRVLLIASEFAFCRIIGIDFSPELVAIARNNIARLSTPLQHTQRIEVELADVVEYVPPNVPLVCYLYNPFQHPVLSSVESNLRASFEHCNRDIYVIYVQPEHREVFDNSGLWQLKIDDPLFAVYRAPVDHGFDRC